jgi:hypothetical protein
MSLDLIFTQIYPMINYFCLISILSSIFGDKKDTIGLSKTTKNSTLIFLPTPTHFILFLLFLGRFWGVTWVMTNCMSVYYTRTMDSCFINLIYRTNRFSMQMVLYILKTINYKVSRRNDVDLLKFVCDLK